MPYGAYEDGWVASDLSDDFPGLGLISLAVELTEPLVGRVLQDRMSALEENFSGAVVRELPMQPITGAYRVFYRQIGLDPDQTPTPLERRLAVRVLEGRFRDRGLLSSALTIAMVETEVPIYAFDAALPAGPLGISLAREGDEVGTERLDEGAIVVADIVRPLALVFPFDGAPSPNGPDEHTTELILYAIRVPGLPAATVGEALWVAAELLTGGV